MLIVARDFYPPFRVDVTTLFSKYLKKYLKMDWLMRTEERGPGKKITVEDETHYVIGRLGIRGKIDAVVKHLSAFGRILRKEYDIVQCRDTFLIASIYAIVSRLSGAKFVYWMSYPMEEGYLFRAQAAFDKGRYLQALPRWIIGKLGQISLYRIALPLAHHVFVQSDQMKIDVAGEGVPDVKITPVPMGIDTATFLSEPGEIASDAFYSGQKAILYLGTLDPARQMGIVAAGVAKAMRERSDTIFVLIGRASDAERSEILQYFADLTSRIFFLDQMPLSMALKHVRRADVCLAPYPSSPKMLASATPTKLVEYIAMGRRVVANFHPDQSTVIASTGAGLLSDFSSEGFAKAIVDALDLGELTNTEVQRAEAWIRENRDYVALSEMVADVYVGDRRIRHSKAAD
ncbi:hypothetical protein ASG68_16795 [Rhizobium sp. Leaf453]|nr:hypothetical protein ASG50_05795 [Rhizobium sp. Leaf386]KQT06391.1 hypothetical protein ASG42_02040 [Rhizobium sp. Leaf391]KQT92461.1 hypothetical protein ASG68_16795 [Rhizobium sp. Leaf453]